MPTTASKVTVGLVENSNTSGSRISIVEPPTWASSDAACEGRKSSGKLRTLLRFTALGIHGVLLTIGTTTRVKWCPSLETPAPTHTATISSFKATMRSTYCSVAKNSKAGMYCSLRAARNTTLSRRPMTTSRPMRTNRIVGFTETALPGTARRATPRHARRDQRDDRRGEDRAVERDVDERAPVATGERDPFGPRGQADRVRAGPVQDPARHGLEVAGERPPRAGEPERLEQDGPEDELLVDDRLGPVRRHVPEGSQARGRRRDEQATADVEDHQLHDIDGVHHLRGAEPVLEPVGRQDADAVEERAVGERLRIDCREVSGREAHRGLLCVGGV